ncbi:TonB-dependent receptor [Mucilaginibacter mallensis]|uniref:TonB-dependent receptor n=1 Tax=Mucilaginibacter mallensis TaxID=652787 RepID=UPI0018D27A77|nr:TonB-dependent receptor [Mucilaginibacter mallensis]
MAGHVFADDNDAGKGTISGYVFTENSKPVENVSVSLKGTSFGSVTNEEGKFHFKAPAGNYTLVVSHVGVKAQETAVIIKASQVTIVPNIILSISTSALQQVTVNANKTNKFSTKKSDDVAKMPLKNLENPQVYTTITKSLITDQLAFSEDDALKNAPGLQQMWNATGRGGDGGSYYNSRGFILQGQLRNGLAGNITNTVDAVNIESIEVLKGPSATLFGSALTSYGGLINRVTKKPYDTVGGEVSYSAGNYHFNRVSADINTPLDGQKNLLLRVNTAFNYQGSFLTNGYNRNFVFDPSLLYKVNSRLTIQLDAEISTGSNTANTIYFFPYGVSIASIGVSNANQLNANYKNSYNNGDLSQRSRNDNFYGEVKYKISDEWTSQTNFSATNSFSDGFGSYYYLLSKDSISRNDQSTRNSKDQFIEVQQNFNGDFKIGKLRNRFVGGLDYIRNNSNQFFFGSSFDKVSLQQPTASYDNFNKASMDAVYAAGAPGFTYPIIFNSNTYSGYISDVLNITDRLIASAAIRFDHFNNEGNYSPTTQLKTGAYNQNAFSPKFGLVYQLVKNQVSLFSNYQNGFTNEQGTDYAGKPFKPEQANQIEGGVKFDVFAGKLSSTLSYYSINVKDIIRPYDALHSIQNGTQQSQGFEAEIIANPFTGFNVITGFAYNDSKYKNTTADVDGLRPGTAASPYSANFWLSYRLPQGVLKGLGLGFGGNYASDNKVVNSRTLGTFTLPEYTVFNASAFYDFTKFRVAVKMNNIGDEKYWIGYSTFNPQQLRSVAASVTYKF